MGHTNGQLAAQNISPQQISVLKEMLSAPPEISVLEAALYHLQEDVEDLAKHCRNVGCTAPYFIAEKPWQKYCSPECSAPATRDAKRKWWHEKKEKGLV